MKEKVSRVSLSVCAVSLILSVFLMSRPTGWFCVVGIFAILPIVAGPRRYRILGIIALLIVVAAGVGEYHTGKRRQNGSDEIQKRDVKGKVISVKLSDFTLSVKQISGQVNGKDFSSKMRTYSTDVMLWNQEVNISFDADGVDNELNEFVVALSEQACWINENRSVIKESIICELLELKNSRWLEENERPVSR